MNEMNGYELSRSFFNWCFENPEKITPTHIAMYFFIIEHCNRLGWKEKFGLPTTMVKDAIGIRNFRTYSNTLNDLVDWGFIKMIEVSKNQYSSNIIAIAKNTKANAKALDKALQKHSQKQSESIDSIDKQGTIKKETPKQEFDFSFVANNFSEPFMKWIEYKKELKQSYKSQSSLQTCYNNLLKLSSGNPAKANIIVDKSIGNGWSGLFEIKGNFQTPEQPNVSEKPKITVNPYL